MASSGSPSVALLIHAILGDHNISRVPTLNPEAASGKSFAVMEETLGLLLGLNR
jgi:hypothetical protein